MPGETLEDMGYVTACASKLAPVKPSISRAHLVRKHGVLHAVTENVRQEDMVAALQQPPSNGVLPIAASFGD